MNSHQEKVTVVNDAEVLPPVDKAIELATTAASSFNPHLMMTKLASKTLDYLTARERTALARTKADADVSLARTKADADISLAQSRAEENGSLVRREAHRAEIKKFKEKTKRLSKRLEQQDRDNERAFQATMKTLSTIREDNKECFDIARTAMDYAKNAQGEDVDKFLNTAIRAINSRR